MLTKRDLVKVFFVSVAAHLLVDWEVSEETAVKWSKKTDRLVEKIERWGKKRSHLTLLPPPEKD